MSADKIRARHLARKAVLYVRQSSAYQVLHNREGRALQYAMRERLLRLGWSEVEVIDEGLGRSAASVARAGFERTMTDTAAPPTTGEPSAGTIGNSVYGRAVEHQPAMALVKRSPKRTANWALAIAHSRGGILHSFSARFKTRNRSFIAASSVGKWPLARTARRSFEFKASMAFVVYSSRRTSPGKA